MEFFDLRTLAMLQGSLVLLLTVAFMVDSWGPLRARRSTKVGLNPTLYFAVRGPTPARGWTEDRRRNGTIPFNPVDLGILS